MNYKNAGILWGIIIIGYYIFRFSFFKNFKKLLKEIVNFLLTEVPEE